MTWRFLINKLEQMLSRAGTSVDWGWPAFPLHNLFTKPETVQQRRIGVNTSMLVLLPVAARTDRRTSTSLISSCGPHLTPVYTETLICWAWYRFRDLCLRNAANDDDLLTFEVANCLWTGDAEDKRCRWRRRDDCRATSIFPTSPTPFRAARGGAPSSWKTSNGMAQSRYCHAFFPAVSLSRTSAPNLFTNKRIRFLWLWIVAMWRGVWPLVDLAFMSKFTPAFSTPYLKHSWSVSPLFDHFDIWFD